MSRNLGSTSCRICYGRVVLEEAARPIRRDEAGAYFFEYEGMLVANAHCFECLAAYLAWVDLSQRRIGRVGGHLERRGRDEREFVDLSFRRSFNDEPAAADLPTPETLARIHREQTMHEARQIQARADKLAEGAATMMREADGPSYWEAYRR